MSRAGEKHPQPWQLEQWKEAIRWFFRAAKEERQAPGATGSEPPDPSVSAPEQGTNWPEWKVGSWGTSLIIAELESGRTFRSGLPGRN
jgi:hypothetical protein